MYSCSSVKYIPENKWLLNNVKIEIDNNQVKKEDVLPHIKQKDNFRILGFIKFHLLVYNLSSQKKPESWLKTIGEAPQIYDELMEYKSKEQLRQYFQNRGFYRAVVSSYKNEIPGKRKVNLTYKIQTGDVYKIDSVYYKFANKELQNIFDYSSEIDVIKPESAFSNEMLQKYRTDLAKVFRNKGYYYFSEEEIKFVADTNRVENRVSLEVQIGLHKESGKDTTKVFSPYYIRNYTIDLAPYAQVQAEEDGEKITDYFALSENIVISQTGQQSYRKPFYTNTMQLFPGELYSLKDVEKTFNSINRTRQFRLIDIQFQETQTPEDTNMLECMIRLAPLNRQSTSFDVEGTNTSGNFGVAGNLNYQHRNLFKGAEIFNIKIKGAIERQQHLTNKNEFFNTRELGAEMNIFFPRLLGPGKLINTLKDLQPRSIISAGYNYQRRPEYTRTIANVRMGYEWKTSAIQKHNWNIIDFNVVNIFNPDKNFIDRIRDEYIKSSFTDHLILAMNYSLEFNSQKSMQRSNYSFAKFNLESAGNILDFIASATKQTKIITENEVSGETTSFYRILNTRFAQYLKSDVEFRMCRYIDKYNSLVSRAFLGVGVPYRNFDVLPFEKRYFTGGANGIRAWQVRSLGPGAYKEENGFYPNQSSDIKLEANLEYRFNLVKYLEGAFFLDAGNIWAINGKDNRPDVRFYWNKFYKQIAVGTGTGLRFDFTYFIFRLDLGMKLRDPSQVAGNGWIIGTRKIVGDDFALSFAIGYPF
jgi:outer membrane protein assembly factor BamA